MSPYTKTFQAVEIGDGGDGRWAAHVRPAALTAEDWLTDEGRTPEGAARARRMFETHMPEMVPALDRLAGQLESPRADTLLTLAAVRPFFSGCTLRAAGVDVAAMLRPPLYQNAYDEWLGTVYTAEYRPAEGRVTYHWPGGESWEQSFACFSTGSRTITLGSPDGVDDR